jgi:hypothetical protein
MSRSLSTRTLFKKINLIRRIQLAIPYHTKLVPSQQAQNVESTWNQHGINLGLDFDSTLVKRGPLGCND